MARNALLFLIAALAACRAAPPSDATAGTEARADDAARPVGRDSLGPVPSDALVAIRADGIGVARIGMTIGALRSALPPGRALGALSPYLVDIDGFPVVEGGDTLYRVLIVAGEPRSDDTAIRLLATSHPRARTVDGIGPGSSLADAAVVWGEPVLTYSTDDESREWAAFPRLPANLSVRVAPESGTSFFAGTYETQAGVNRTTRYDPAARIMMVLVGGP